MYDCFVWSIYVHILSYLRHISLQQLNRNAVVTVRPYLRQISLHQVKRNARAVAKERVSYLKIWLSSCNTILAFTA